MTSATGQVENRQAPRRCSPDSVEMSVTSTILIVIIIVIVTFTIVIITAILP